MATDKQHKHIGQVFTPEYIVTEMLDYIGYFGNAILEKHIIDNSCGDGAFLRVVVSRYVDAALSKGLSTETIKEHLSTHIHGLDTDNIALEECYNSLNEICASFGIHNVEWDIHCKNTLKEKSYNGKMDFVVGNPPYVRVHNLDETYDEVKQFKFANGGMTDLYLVFFEIGFNMLNETGKMCYITPSSWTNSVAATNMRSYLVNKKNIISLTDLGHFQPFKGATAYTIISLFGKNVYNDKFEYYAFNGETHGRDFVDTLSYSDVWIDSYFYLSERKNLMSLKNIKTMMFRKFVSVKNGFATLADSCFIGEHIPDSPITIPIIKGSTAKWTKGIFPYDKQGKALSKEYIFSFPQIKEHFEKEKTNLLKGKEEFEGWWLYGRTQALVDVYKYKIAINSLVRKPSDMKIHEVKEGQGVYSGLYIIGNVDIDTIKNILQTDEFVEYVKCIKKYKSGGYYTFNTKDVEQFINYKLSTNQDGQSRVSQSYFEFVYEVY